MMQKTSRIRPRSRLVLRQQTVRVLGSQELTQIAGGETTSDTKSQSGCPWCEAE